MITITKAPNNLYNITILLNGRGKTYPLHLSTKALVIEIADIEEQLRKDTGYKDVRVLCVAKVDELIQVNL